MSEAGSDAAEARLNRLLNLILETAVEALRFDAATITARDPDRGLGTIAATEQRLVELDEAQYESGQPRRQPGFRPASVSTCGRAAGLFTSRPARPGR
jgi:hypothetical protein